MDSTQDTGTPNSLQTVLRIIPMPADLAISGQISAGWLLSRLDQAGAVLPCGAFAAPAMLSQLGPITILSTPRLGNCVTFRARLLGAGPHSAEVDVEAVSERRGDSAKVAVLRARLTYVPAPPEEAGSFFSMPFNHS